MEFASAHEGIAPDARIAISKATGKLRRTLNLGLPVGCEHVRQAEIAFWGLDRPDLIRCTDCMTATTRRKRCAGCRQGPAAQIVVVTCSPAEIGVPELGLRVLQIQVPLCRRCVGKWSQK